MRSIEIGQMLILVTTTLALPLGVVLLFEIREWRARRRLDGVPFAVQFEPPAGLSPTEAGVLVDGEAHQHDVLATVFDLANRGYLRVKEVTSSDDEEDFELTLLRPDFREDAKLKPHESHILGLVFGAGKQVLIGDVIGSGILSAAEESIEKRVFGQMAVMGYYDGRPVRRGSAHLRQVASVLLAALLVPVVMPVVASGAAVAALLLTVSAVTAAWLCLLYLRIKPAITEAGLEVRRQALGFREYLRRAEKYRLDWQIDGNTFGGYMPYALAFDVLEPFMNASREWPNRAPEWFETGETVEQAQRLLRFARDTARLAVAFGASLTDMAKSWSKNMRSHDVLVSQK